jgi:hypothetical protein
VKAGAKKSNQLATISDYVGRRREMEEWSSVLIGSLWDRMKSLGSHTTTEQTNRRQDQEFRMVLKRGSLAGPGRGQEEV